MFVSAWGELRMRSSSGAQRAPAIESDRQVCQANDTSVGDALADICKLVLWPDDTAAHLAAAIQRATPPTECSVRQAERYLGGQCDWSGAAQAVIISEILKRRGVRNVKVVPRR